MIFDVYGAPSDSSFPDFGFDKLFSGLRSGTSRLGSKCREEGSTLNTVSLVQACRLRLQYRKVLSTSPPSPVVVGYTVCRNRRETFQVKSHIGSIVAAES